MEKKKVAAALAVGFALVMGYAYGMGMMGYGMPGGYGAAPGYGFDGAQKGGLLDRLFGGYRWGGHGGMMGYGMGGMMGGYGAGMMGGVMGGCGGMWGGYPPAAGEEITPEEAEEAIAGYLSYINNPELEVREIMEFEYNYYAIVGEKDTGKGAFELLVDKRTGAVVPEPGPNMMWNLKYGHHATGYLAENRITSEEAVEIAQRYLDAFFPGWKADDEPVEFYGYYTLHTLDEEGGITGMLSVNGFTGRVWFHTWHGRYLGEEHE